MNLFSPEERDAVEDKYGATPPYAMAENVCRRCLADRHTFTLHPSELFYLVFYVIDTLRGKTSKDARRFADNCYAEHVDYLRHDKQTGASDADLHAAVVTVLHTTVQWVLDSGARRWLWVASCLEAQVVEHHEVDLTAFASAFARCVNEDDERRLFMNRYMTAPSLISQEIDDTLDAMDEEKKKCQSAIPHMVYCKGDYVENKHVATQIDNVAKGGIGVLTEGKYT